MRPVSAGEASALRLLGLTLRTPQIAELMTLKNWYSQTKAACGDVWKGLDMPFSRSDRWQWNGKAALSRRLLRFGTVETDIAPA